MRIEEGTLVEGSQEEAFVQVSFMLFMSFVLFIMMSTYSASIVQEIASEKGTRIMEVILSTTSTNTHLAAKLIGIILVLATQFFVYGLLLLYGLPFIEEMNQLDGLFDGQTLTQMIRPLYGTVFLYFLLGLILYIIVSAFLGSLTNKVEDTNKMLTPIQTLTGIGFYFSLAMMNGMDNALVRAMSHVPLFTPFIMPMRIFHEQVGRIEGAVSIGVSVAFILFLLLVSIVFYRTNVLVYSDTTIVQSLKQSLFLLRSDRKSRKV